MLHVVDHTETDEFGNAPDEGGALVVGVRFTLWTAPIGPAREGFVPWLWSVTESGPGRKTAVLADARDSTFVPEDEPHAQAVLLTAREAAKQLAFTAAREEQRVISYNQECGFSAAEARLRVHQWEAPRRAAEIAEFAEAVECYLHYQRWLCGYL